MAQISKTRLETFSDGVFTIMITLLILPLHEVLSKFSSHHLSDALKNMTPAIIVYIISFIIIGLYWLNHHQLFQIIKEPNMKIIWLNMLHLLFISFISISTAIVGIYTFSYLSAIIYGLNLIIANLFSYLIIRVLINNKNLVNPEVDKRIFSLFKKYYPIKGLIYLIAILLAFVSPLISYLIFFCVNIYLIFLSFKNPILTKDKMVSP
jgi:uncharacterized membrane protein